MDIYTKNAINNKLTKKQDTLVSGTNIKTINGNSLLGSGDVVISGSADFATANTQLNGLTINGTNYKLLDVKVNDGSSLIIGENRSLASGSTKATAIGNCSSSSAMGTSSTATGFSSKATRSYSTASGFYSSASGISSTASGSYSDASGNYSTAIGGESIASADYSTAIGGESEVYVPRWFSIDGTTDDSQRTFTLKSTDNLFFRNENVDSAKTTQASYTSGKTLTQVLSGKQDALVSGTNIKTINGNSMLGSGNLTISGSGSLYQHNLEIELSAIDYLYITIFNNSATALTVENIDQVFNALKANMTGVYHIDSGTATHGFYLSDIVANTSFDIWYGTTKETITKGVISDITDSVSQIL